MPLGYVIDRGEGRRCQRWGRGPPQPPAPSIGNRGNVAETSGETPGRNRCFSPKTKMESTPLFVCVCVCAFCPQRIHEFKIVRPPVPFRARWGGQSSTSIQPCPPLSLSNGTDFRPTFTTPHKSPLCSSSEGRGHALHPHTGIPAVPSSGHGRTISVWPGQRSQPPPSLTLPSNRQQAASAHRQTCGNATRPFDRNANGVAISRMRPA